MQKTGHSMIIALGLIVGLPVIVNSTTKIGDTQPTGLILKLGHTDFLNYCAACHGVGGKGDGTVAEYLTLAAPDLTQLRKMNAGSFPRERIQNVIDGRAEVKVHGERDMPVWGDWFKFEAGASVAGKGATEEVVTERINALVTYIESIQEN